MEQHLEEKVDRMRRAEKPEKEKQLTQKGRVQTQTTLSPGASGLSNLEKILLLPVQQWAWSPRSSDF